MHRRMRMSVRFIKKDHGSGRPTWRMAKETDYAPVSCVRKVNNKTSKRLWLSGSSIKAY